LSDLLTGERAGLAPLVNALVEVRLLSRSRDTVEVAHEALLRQPPISDWLAEDREFLVWRDRLGRARAEFDANARGLLVGRELQLARTWLQTRAADLAPADRAFIETSAAEDDRQRGEAEAKERALQAAELARRTAELEASRRAQRLTVRWLVASSVFAVMALALGALALLARNQAGAEAERATAERNRAVEAIKAREAARARYLGRRSNKTHLPYSRRPCAEVARRAWIPGRWEGPCSGEAGPASSWIGTSRLSTIFTRLPG
jgi:hypothetical protein